MGWPMVVDPPRYGTMFLSPFPASSTNTSSMVFGPALECPMAIGSWFATGLQTNNGSSPGLFVKTPIPTVPHAEATGSAMVHPVPLYLVTKCVAAYDSGNGSGQSIGTPLEKGDATNITGASPPVDVNRSMNCVDWLLP